MLVLNVLACNYIPHTNVPQSWGGGGGDIMVLSSLRRYANIKRTKILIGVLPRVTCRFIGERIAGTKDEPNLIFEYQPPPPPAIDIDLYALW